MVCWSQSVSKAVEFTGGPEVEETAKFADMSNKFFDCLNFVTAYHKWNVFQRLYKSGTDFRLKVCDVIANLILHDYHFCLFMLQWLEDTFPKHLDDWEKVSRHVQASPILQKSRCY